MKKIVIDKAGGYDRLRVEEQAVPSPKAGEVLVATDAIGVNYADCIIRMGLYATAKKYVGWPITPGFEFAGRVVSDERPARIHGDDDSDPVSGGSFKAGDRVVGLSRFGAYATHVSAPRHQLFKIPESMSMAEAGALPVIFFTAYYPLFELLKTRAGMKILVHSAAGGVGSALIQLARIAGCEVTAVVGAPHKVEAARELGATHVIDKSSEDLWATVRRLAPEGYDIVLDANGVSTLKHSYEATARGGRLVIYGFHSMMPKVGGRPNYPKLAYDFLRTPRFSPLKLTDDNKSVLAFNLSDLFDKTELMAEGMQTILGWYQAGKIRLPKITPYRFDDVASAHRALESGQTVGKLVLTH